MQTLNTEQTVYLALRSIVLHDIAFKFPLNNFYDTHKCAVDTILTYILEDLEISDSDLIQQKMISMLATQTVIELSNMGMAESDLESNELTIDHKIFKHWRKRL